MTSTAWRLVREDEPTHPHGPPRPPGDDAGWLPTSVPGAVGACPDLADTYGPDAATTADDVAWWFHRRVHTTNGDYDLDVSDVATYADFYVDGQRIGHHDNAFTAARFPLGRLTTGTHDIHVRIAALHEHPVPARPRARWRSNLVPDRSLRWRRTPLLGRIPSWPGTHPPVGILGHCHLVPASRPHRTTIRTELHDSAPTTDTDGPKGVVTVTVHHAHPAATGHLDPTAPPRPAPHRHPFDVTALHAHLVDDTPQAPTADQPAPTAHVVGTWEPCPHGATATLVVPAARTWWPHTHGHPHTYRLVVTHDGDTLVDRRIGFSRVHADRTDGRFSLIVNDRPVFVRGACWVPPDATTWRNEPRVIDADLARLAAAGFNLVRLTGTNTYESDMFFDLAARHGLLVWQDVMLATFDPPEDDTWLAGFDAEVRHRLERLQGRPHVAAVCGGTETLQQPTLLGLDPRIHVRALHDVLPAAVAATLPDTPLVESSPSGGPLPVSVDHGVSHYFGVGAYERPLHDAVTADVSFASEALAFAVPAERLSVAEAFGVHPDISRRDDWVGGTPRDRGVDWDFTHTTAHYVYDLFGVRRGDVDDDRWLDLERATLAHVITATFAAWRSGTTRTSGAVVLSHRDLTDGPGWGLIDARGRPKAPLLAARSCLAPQSILAVDRGLDGIRLWLVDDHLQHPPPGGEPRSADATAPGTLRLRLYGDAPHPHAETDVPVRVPAGSAVDVHAEAALGGFRDIGWAWRFGHPTYRFLAATWTDATGHEVASVVAPLGPLALLVGHAPPTHAGTRTAAATAPTPALPAAAPEHHEPALDATHDIVDGVLHVTVRAQRPVAFVHLDAPGWIPRNGWVHAVPALTVTLVADPDPHQAPDRHTGPAGRAGLPGSTRTSRPAPGQIWVRSLSAPPVTSRATPDSTTS